MAKITKNKIDYIEYRKGMEGTWEIFDIAVNSKRQSGIGRSLIDDMIKDTGAKYIYAFTRESNVVARKFYNALGFTEMLMPCFYGKENAIMVTKIIYS
jgi:ribosomal protein S18 acetylase RimI-like enzyme